MLSATDAPPAGAGAVVGAPLPHESAHLHVSGEARYADDIPLPASALHAAVGWADAAHARLRAIDLSAVRAAADVVTVLTAADIPGQNNFGGIVKDDPLLAEGEIRYHGQPAFLVVAKSHLAARRAARAARFDLERLPAILTIADALAAGSHVLPPVEVVRGKPEDALAAAPHRLRGRLACGGQDHFYLEGQIAVALPDEDGQMRLVVSTQHPSEVQHIVAHALGEPERRRARGMPAHGRRLRWQGEPAGAIRCPGRHRCAAARCRGQAAARPRRRHDDHRQAASVRIRIRPRIRS